MTSKQAGIWTNKNRIKMDNFKETAIIMCKEEQGSKNQRRDGCASGYACSTWTNELSEKFTALSIEVEGVESCQNQRQGQPKIRGN